MMTVNNGKVSNMRVFVEERVGNCIEEEYVDQHCYGLELQLHFTEKCFECKMCVIQNENCEKRDKIAQRRLSLLAPYLRFTSLD